MSSTSSHQPEAVADKVLKRAEVGKMARCLQSRLALAQFKAKRGWEDLSLDAIEPKYEEELRQRKAAIRRRRMADGEILSDSSSSASDLQYPTRALMSSPLKAPLFSDAIGSSNGSTGHRKRTYISSFDADVNLSSSPTKRYRVSPTAHKSSSNHVSWNDSHLLTQSSPIKPRRQPHFKTSTGPDVSLFPPTTRLTRSFTTPNFAAPDEDDDDLLPAHSFQVNGARSSPPSTPPMRNRRLAPNNADKAGNNFESRDEGAQLLLYMKSSPTPAALPPRSHMEPPSTPPPKHLGFTPQAMATPNLNNPMFPHTPGQAFDFADYLTFTPSPAQKSWRTPNGYSSAKTPRSVARRRLEAFDQHT
ncbi:hypothetical protein VMCG_03711 [Cytospora schulzeri]|uniref:Uncharacterized protein n=1 Tax=Cytospora schulzeri TaxID=448051 RepID=A0A423WUX9_9PEZI|nr:hypothetical protein VMCG_03711 [Valsa malicola]